MINPDIRRLLDPNGISISSQNLGASDVANDDIRDIFDVKTNAYELGRGVFADDRLVAGYSNFGRSADGPRDVNDGSSISCGSFGEFGKGRDGCGRAASAAGCAVSVSIVSKR